ncbi:hypothetical protein S40288_10722 [Stachybotrys chartarum IBT 40288]|nr:hypothetical protein S40288_10722 [Stachybotrys chartarum IBT 40288]
MSPSQSAAAPAATTTATTTATPTALGDNRGIKFEIRTGTNRWTCTLQDRNAYERNKAVRSSSTDSVTTMSSASSIGSSH